MEPRRVSMNSSSSTINSSSVFGSDTSVQAQHKSMTDNEAKERRASIQAIMRDPKLTPQERRRSVQSLMDGRRRSSTANTTQIEGGEDNDGSAAKGMGMAAAAAMAAAEFSCSSDDDDDDRMDTSMRSIRSASKSKSKKRPSFVFGRSPSGGKSGASEKSEGRTSKRRPSLRDSFMMGFSKMGVSRGDGGEGGDGGGGPGLLDAGACYKPAAAKANDASADPTALSRKMEKARPECNHYERNCSMVSPCCGLVFGCRICHNEAPVLPPPFLLDGADGMCQDVNGNVKNDGTMVSASSPPRKPPAFSMSSRSASLPSNFSEEETHHEVDRFAIKEIICRECFTRQSSKTNNCINCNIQFGTYHCMTCNLWMSADEEPYHCLKCGFCRVGGRENFTHCDACGMCIDALLFEDHNCKSGKYMSNCPVCQEDLFSSRMASHEMPCGHAIHWHCFRELTSHDTRCPVCKKTAETHDQMEQTWNAMAMGIALQPVPADMARVVDLFCNDCENKSLNQRWHFLGVRCQHCTSFNTTVERTVSTGQEAADFLGPSPDVTAQAQWAEGHADQNVLNALMGGRGAASGGEDMDTNDSNQQVAADVLSILNGTNQSQPFPPLNERDEMEQG